MRTQKAVPAKTVYPLAATTTTSRKPWIKKTPVDVVLDQIGKTAGKGRRTGRADLAREERDSPNSRKPRPSWRRTNHNPRSTLYIDAPLFYTEDAMKFANKPKDKESLPPFAFYQGAHGMSLAETLCESSSLHTNRTALQTRRRLGSPGKLLEATVQRLERLRPRIDAAWNELLRRIGHHSPPIATAILIAFLGVGAAWLSSIPSCSGRGSMR